MPLATTQVAAMVTLYHSESTVLTNVDSYLDQVGKLYVIDNSEQPDERLREALQLRSPRLQYLAPRGNEGLGVALNRAAEQALADGFSHLLMMDDDSSLPAEAVEQLYQTAVARPEAGIVSAVMVDQSALQEDRSTKPPTVDPVLTAITAGSLLNLAAYQVAGPFQEDLFIDWVDLEYCFRLKRHGFPILADGHVRLLHRIGIKKKIRLLGFIPYQWRSHNPVRLYYKFRNSLYLLRRDQDVIPARFKRRFHKELRRNLYQILLAEPNKGRFFSLIRKAVADARTGKLGKLEE